MIEDHVRVADNDPANAFVAIYVRVAQGRTSAVCCS